MFSFSSKIPGENGLAGYFEAPSDPPTGPFWGTDLVTKISKHNSKTPTLLTLEFLEKKCTVGVCTLAPLNDFLVIFVKC